VQRSLFTRSVQYSFFLDWKSICFFPVCLRPRRSVSMLVVLLYIRSRRRQSRRIARHSASVEPRCQRPLTGSNWSAIRQRVDSYVSNSCEASPERTALSGLARIASKSSSRLTGRQLLTVRKVRPTEETARRTGTLQVTNPCYSLSYHILVILPSHFSSMEQMLMLMMTFLEGVTNLSARLITVFVSSVNLNHALFTNCSNHTRPLQESLWL